MKDQVEYIKKFLITLDELVKTIDKAGGCIPISEISEMSLIKFLDIAARNDISFHVKERP
jgi:hypothetical protein